MTPPAREVPRVAWRNGRAASGSRIVPEETPVAITYNRATLAVMLATPADLEDFGLGFSLTERIAERPEDIEDLQLIHLPEGIELRMWLSPARATAAEARRRKLAGPSGCGLCGIESLAEAIPPARTVTALTGFDASQIAAAISAIPAAQRLNQSTHAVHAAGFWHPARGLIALREDVGRHNALDKLAGALARGRTSAEDGILVLSSRLSVELIQKAAVIGVPVLAAVSAPTALAIRVAEQAGITLVGVARDDGFEVFTHPRRIDLEAPQHVA